MIWYSVILADIKMINAFQELVENQEQPFSLCLEAHMCMTTKNFFYFRRLSTSLEGQPGSLYKNLFKGRNASYGSVVEEIKNEPSFLSAL